jgi:serine/threonine-protein kinase HipA
LLGEVPVAVIRRFDRDQADGRIPYQSAASLLQASREEDRSYTEIADAIRAHGHAPTQDVRQLWRRLVFNLLITNVDDHLQNHGFLHVAHGQWRLAPAFDINPFPDKEQESKTWLSEQDGPITDLGCCWRAPPISGWTKPRPGHPGRSACSGGELAAGRTQRRCGFAAGRAG